MAGLVARVGLLAVLAAMGAAPPQAPPPSREQLRDLVQRLGHPEYAIRQHAEEELQRWGFQAFEVLEEAAESLDLEVARRAEMLLRTLRQHYEQPDDTPAVKQLLAGYDAQPIQERLARIAQLAQQPDLAGVPALCRLVKYERSELVSNWAALEILDQGPLDPPGQARQAEILRRELAGSRRRAAQWLLAYTALCEDPKGRLAAWAQCVEAERVAYLREPQASSPAIVAWLLYQLAEVYARQGQPERAEQAAQQALQLSPSSDPARQRAHLQTARSLWRRGQFKWAEAEFRQVADGGSPLARVTGLKYLAEMFHDQGNHQAAAEALQNALEVFSQQKIGQEDLGSRRYEMIARMHYFRACHAKEQGDRPAEARHLEEALRADPSEVDALIAFYRLPDASPEQRQRATRLVQKVAARLKEEIGENPDNANTYNQYAWLVGNTEGDLDEALKFSRMSLELSPNNAAYLDTLAHVHFARGELEEAVRVQTKAVQLEPHSGLLSKELQVFRAALQAKKKPAPKR